MRIASNVNTVIKTSSMWRFTKKTGCPIARWIITSSSPHAVSTVIPPLKRQVAQAPSSLLTHRLFCTRNQSMLWASTTMWAISFAGSVENRLMKTVRLWSTTAIRIVKRTIWPSLLTSVRGVKKISLAAFWKPWVENGTRLALSAW